MIIDDHKSHVYIKGKCQTNPFTQVSNICIYTIYLSVKLFVNSMKNLQCWVTTV